MNNRDSFQSRWGFILACIGSAVGMGNIWMFPTRVSLYGGGSFLIPYILFVILIGFTGVITEMSFGRATRSGPIDAFGIACEKKGHRKLGETFGLIPVFGSLAMAIGYTVVMGWILKYAIGTLTGSTLAYTDVEEYGAAFGSMASAFGNNLWQVAALVLCMLILMLGVGGGIERAGKIMMPLFFLLFVILAVYVAFQPGAIDGYRYIFRIDPKAFSDPTTWIFALGQAFFSLSVAGNGTLIYGSYLSDKENIPSSASKVALFDTLAAILRCTGYHPGDGNHRSQIKSGRSGTSVYFPAPPDPHHAGRTFNRYHFLCRSIAGRNDFPDQPVRSSDCNCSGEISPIQSSSLCSHRDHRYDRLSADPGHCLRLDGCAIYLYLPARRRTGRHHVLLGLRKNLCRKRGQQRP